MIPCPDCKRHIHESDASCPFCGRAQAATSTPWTALLGAALVTATMGLSACSTDSKGDEAGTTTVADTESDTDTETTNTTQEEDGPNDLDNGGGSFYAGPEDETTAGGVPQCDPFLQDCNEGEKCVPWASSGGNFDANKCVTVVGEQAAGEACNYDGPVASTDDCDGQSFCWSADEDGVGVCRAFCEGTADDPECAAEHSCLIANNGSINLCIDTCDPLAPDCPEDQVCAWAGSGFLCVDSEGTGLLGEPCDQIADCGPGLICLTEEVLPACAGTACCVEFCNVDDPQPVCTLEGTACEPFYPPGEAPEGYENVGVCISP